MAGRCSRVRGPGCRGLRPSGWGRRPGRRPGTPQRSASSPGLDPAGPRPGPGRPRRAAGRNGRDQRRQVPAAHPAGRTPQLYYEGDQIKVSAPADAKPSGLAVPLKSSQIRRSFLAQRIGPAGEEPYQSADRTHDQDTQDQITDCGAHHTHIPPVPVTGPLMSISAAASSVLRAFAKFDSHLRWA